MDETGFRTDAERLGDSFVAELYLSEAVSQSIDKKVGWLPWHCPKRFAFVGGSYWIGQRLGAFILPSRFRFAFLVCPAFVTAIMLRNGVVFACCVWLPWFVTFWLKQQIIQHEIYCTMEDLDFQVDAVPWWLPVPNASWRQPEGFDSGLEPPKSRFGDRWMHPAVHISWQLVAFRRGFWCGYIFFFLGGGRWEFLRWPDDRIEEKVCMWMWMLLCIELHIHH